MTEKTTGNADIQENRLTALSPELLNTLLKDHTMSRDGKQCNIFWATPDYEHLGNGYEYQSQILPELITGKNGNVVMPRVMKHKSTQSVRSREMAEVFTPSWICNAQNNLIDEAWFGRKDVFNKEITTDDGTNTWQVNEERITFPEGKTWKDYVRDNRMEITCGEAPYLVSRYDTTTGEFIPVEQRIGLLDRKLRVVSENTTTSSEWLEAVRDAYKSIYAYEYIPKNSYFLPCAYLDLISFNNSITLCTSEYAFKSSGDSWHNWHSFSEFAIARSKSPFSVKYL